MRGTGGWCGGRWIHVESCIHRSLRRPRVPRSVAKQLSENETPGSAAFTAIAAFLMEFWASKCVANYDLTLHLLALFRPRILRTTEKWIECNACRAVAVGHPKKYLDPA